MKLSNLGEKKIIKELMNFIDIGDDAAYIPFDDKFLVASTDMMYQKTHILKEMSYRQIGKKIVTINLSDIAAMGAAPFGFLLSYGSPDIELVNFNEIISGVNEQCKKYNAKFLGGDTNQTDELTLAGTALGVTEKPILRSRAEIGDVVAVTNFLGTSALGVDILIKKLMNFNEIAQEILKETLEPEPRIYDGKFLKNYANSMADISDSLAMSLYDLAEMSDVGIKVNLNKIPILNNVIRTSRELELNPINYALYGGGDYELLFTVSEEKWGKIENLINKNKNSEFNLKFKFTKIGEVIKGGGVFNTNNKKIKKLGYEHFTQII